MPSRKRLCPRQARLHRHCLDSLEIPFSHPCILPPPPACQVPPPVCQVPPHICQVSPPACQTQSRSGQVTPSACQIRPLECPDSDIFCQVPPTACQIEPPSCQVEYPICQNIPPACAAFKSRLCQGTTYPYQINRHPVSQIKPPTCQVPPPSCSFQPIGCQVDDPACQLQSPSSQFLPPNCQNQPPCAMKHPICQWDQDFCTAQTCRDSHKCRNGSQSPTPFCQNSTDEDDIMYSNCLGRSTQSESGCENVEENDFDNQNSRHRSSNNQQDKSRDDDELNQIPITYSNTPSRTNQNANKTPNYRNDEENRAQTRNIPHKECVNSCQNQCSSDAAGSANGQTMNDNLNNNSTRTNFRSIGSFSDPNDINDSQIPQSSQDIANIPVSKGNVPQIFNNADSSNLRETIPCCRPGYFQEQALQPNSLDNENYFQTRQEFNKEPCSSKADNKICQSCCDTSDDEMSTYQTTPYTDIINTDENFTQSSGYDAEELIGPSIHASSCPRSTLKNLSNMRSRSGAKVHMQEHSNGTCMDCSTSCNISDSNNKVNNPHESNSPDYGIESELHSEHSKSQTRFANQSGESEFENSVRIKGRKQFANCCKRGISKVLEPPELPANVSKAECDKKKACVQEVGASSCASTTCVANNTDSACGCRYPPAFKQFSCAGNINGTCNCSDKTK